MKIWDKLFMIFLGIALRYCAYKIQNESADQKEYSWLSNSIHELEKLLHGKQP